MKPLQVYFLGQLSDCKSRGKMSCKQ